MGKYDRLHIYLRRRRGAGVRLTFGEIERIIGGLLPNAADAPGWWTNTPTASRGFVQCRAWLDAGFHAAPTDQRGEVKFVPIDS